MSNYPAGAKNDPCAPYNQPVTQYDDREVTVCYSISKTIKLSVPGTYKPVEEERDVVFVPYEDVQYTDLYSEQEISLDEVLKFARAVAEHRLSEATTPGLKQYYKAMMRASSDWLEDDFEVVED